MGSELISNPGAQESEGASVGSSYLNAVNGDTVTLTQGMIVSIITGKDYTSSSFTVKREPTTADFLVLGVVVGQDIPVGGTGRIVTEGLAQVLMDGATTLGHLCLTSSGTAGSGLDSATATLGKTVGTVLQTIGSAGKAFVHVHKM